MMNALARYPKAAPGGLVLRLLGPADAEPLAEFFRGIPVDERQLFREDVTRSSVISGWLKNLDPSRILTIVALRGPRIVAEATLRRDQDGWSRHLGRIRLTLDPAVRRQGLARFLVAEFISLAKPLGLALLEAEVLDVQACAARLFEGMGFQCAAILPQRAIDFAGSVHDVHLYSQMIHLPEGLAPEAALKEADADLGGG